MFLFYGHTITPAANTAYKFIARSNKPINYLLIVPYITHPVSAVIQHG